LAGLPGIILKLKESHESSARIFKVLHLDPLEDSERKEVIDRGLADAEKKNDFRVDITPEAKNFLANLSEGYPHFLQEFSFCAFARDQDNNIGISDVIDGAYEENGAMDQLGKKYFADLYLEPDPKGAGRLSSAVIHRAGINRAGDSACGRESIERSIASLASAFPAI
jgi:hypothetical protein